MQYWYRIQIKPNKYLNSFERHIRSLHSFVVTLTQDKWDPRWDDPKMKACQACKKREKTALYYYVLTASKVIIHIFKSSGELSLLEPVCCKKQQKKFLTSYWFEEYGTSEGPEWFQIDCIWVQVIPLIIQDQFYTIQNLFHKPVTGQELFFLFLTANRL